jgi:hypothetical protein
MYISPSGPQHMLPIIIAYLPVPLSATSSSNILVEHAMVSITADSRYPSLGSLGGVGTVFCFGVQNFFL